MHKRSVLMCITMEILRVEKVLGNDLALNSSKLMNFQFCTWNLNGLFWNS
jgi:hypothetical protein